jgi:Zn ribbon nucleic-acid-binding protein
MPCAVCGSGAWQVVGFVPGEHTAVETRECLDCGYEWTEVLRA